MTTKLDYAKKIRILPGRAFPIGSAVRENGIRFAVFSRHATRVWLAIFENDDDEQPVLELEYDAGRHRVGDVWSMYVEGLSAGTLYAYRMDGPYDPRHGLRYDRSRFLLDPYAKAFVGNVARGTAKSIAIGEKPDWVDDIHPRVPFDELVIYETHVRGCTIHPSSNVQHPGTYLGLIEKTPYFQELGVTAVELLPIHEFGESLDLVNPLTGEQLANYWGYNSIGFFAPCGKYATTANGEQISEFRHMVSKFHEAGIEIILDVVLNHTFEGNEKGPTVCFRGIDNAIYYMLDDEGRYLNYSGCGNTLNCNHPLVRDFILDCLRYWVTVMHVDGFRFDLASILGRDTRGRIAENAVLIERIAEDPALRDTKLIAEAWDAGGAYQVGSFGDIRWAEWNGRYRDDVRKFWRGDQKMRGPFATRLSGSADLYELEGRTPGHSVNFVTAHDGFTLRDLVSYNDKHNLANGENNVDGSPFDFSWNYGDEGDTTDPAILALRMRMQKNCLATLFLSLGVPMLLGGDEFGRTQKGNNNAYCQDNDISWFNWDMVEQNRNLFEFCKRVIRFRKQNPACTRLHYFDGKPVGAGGQPDLAWYNRAGKSVAWDGTELSLACRIDGSQNLGSTLYLMFNPSLNDCEFNVPDGRWVVRLDTAQDAPLDLPDAADAPALAGPAKVVLAHKSMMVLAAQEIF
ncbi:MAG: glycogen debranching protein GlgX [Candidatus Hydrogenedentes bacterium]|nr:glycogen debranching protein GlgX [Candidatus Hydrogenedentota bacterium]